MRITLLDDALYPLISQFFLQHIGGMPTLRLGPLCLSYLEGLASPPKVGSHGLDSPVSRPAGPRLGNGDAGAYPLLPPQCLNPAMPTCPYRFRACAFRAGSTVGMNMHPARFLRTRASGNAFSKRWSRDRSRLTFHSSECGPGVLLRWPSHPRAGVHRCLPVSVKPAKTVPQHRHILGTLARYSFYAGTGRKTTMGMGVTGFMGSERR